MMCTTRVENVGGVMRVFVVVVGMVTCLLMTGCMQNLQGDSYSRDDARKVQTVQYGKIESVRMVVIEGTKTPVGAIAGAGVGGVAGSTVGGGKGQTIATILGAVAGGVVGSKAEEAVTKSQGVELVIRLEGSDRTISVVQAHDEKNPLSVGDRVRLMSVNGQTRAAKD
jgi:outer membrane lipoprotein SlyB